MIDAAIKVVPGWAAGLVGNPHKHYIFKASSARVILSLEPEYYKT